MYQHASTSKAAHFVPAKSFAFSVELNNRQTVVCERRNKKRTAFLLLLEGACMYLLPLVSFWHGKEVSPGPLDGVAGTKVRGKVAEIHRSKENVVGPDGEW